MKRTFAMCTVACLCTIGIIGPAAHGAVVRPGGDPACERILWADPFDFYTQWAFDNKDNPAYPNGTLWQGGPIPAGAVDPDDTPDQCNRLWPQVVIPPVAPNCDDTSWQAPNSDLARANWVSNDCPVITSPRGIEAEPGRLDIIYGGGSARDDKCYGAGQISETLFMSAQANYTWGTGGSYHSMPQFTYDLTDRINAMAEARGLGVRNAVNGTDENPLTLIFYLRSGTWDNPHAPYNNSYVELSFNDDTAPTDYVWRGNPVAPPKGQVDPEYCPQGPYPVICQQARVRNDDACVDGQDLAWLNNNCPALIPPYNPETGTGKTWASIAFGLLAIMDTDPCKYNCATAHVPTNNHFAVFDGNKWQQLRAGRFTGLADGYNQWPPEEHMQPGGTSNDFVTHGGDTMVYLKITTNNILIYARNFDGQGVSKQWHATVPRVYKGGFNKIRWGVGPGCELDKDTGECKVGGTPKQCLTYSSATEGYRRTIMDSMSLLDGVLEYIDTVNGACCNRKDGTCTITDQATCLATPDGRWDGVGTTCGQFQCCPKQYGDTDGDGDVDMTDFAYFQRCLSQPGQHNSDDPLCECFDVNGDGMIDMIDLTAFTGNGLEPSDPNYVPGCASGAGVPADPNCH
ncbi:MAG TPA: dockerin type I domain-containing protein [Phycisphaerae bacterium]|nr:dockerin type I domain-containing protein [Phycisphaerae bacterium]